MEQFSKEMKARLLDIESGAFISVMREEDAKELGIIALDRVEITNPRNGKKIAAVVDFSSTVVGKNEIGLYVDVKKELRLRQGQTVKVAASPQPESVHSIKKKMDGKALSSAEISRVVEDLAANRLSEVEAAAFMTAVYIHGFNLNETVAMAKALVRGGKRLKIDRKCVVDKHSIGGINGRCTIPIVPIVAAAGCFIPKTSSRAVTSAAGTADAMEVLANVSLTQKQIKKITEGVGGVIAWGGALELAPVDDKIIKIEHPLSLDPKGQVIASVLAKKASVGAKYAVIDIPVGGEMKVKNRRDAVEMAGRFTHVGKKLGIKVKVVLTDGSTPSGPAFGAALEAKHAMEILEGKTFDNLAQKSCELAGAIFELIGKSREGRGAKLAEELLRSGKALKKMKQIIKAQGARALDSERVKVGKIVERVCAERNGTVGRIRIKALKEIARAAGAPADKGAGVFLRVSKGQRVRKGVPLFEIFSETAMRLRLAKNYARKNPAVSLK